MTTPTTPSRILSIDIGTKNFAQALIVDNVIASFSLSEIPDKTIVGRCKCIPDVLYPITPDTYVIVERQVPRNTVAMGIMYAVVSYALTKTSHVHIVPATDKFKHDNLPCPKRYSDRKRLSVQHVYHNYLPDNLKHQFDEYKKKDDIADAIFMACTFQN